jgi:hypothetical protein
MDKRIEKLINIIRNINEEGAIVNSLGGGNIAGTPEAGDALGQYPKEKKKKKKYMSGGRGSRKMWLDYIKGK